MRRLIALLLILCLPLQALATHAVQGCGSHSRVHDAWVEDTSLSDMHHDVAHASSAQADVQGLPDAGSAGDAGAAPATGQCSGCATMCAALVSSPAVGSAQGTVDGVPVPGGDEAFTSVGHDPALKPPISAA